MEQLEEATVDVNYNEHLETLDGFSKSGNPRKRKKYVHNPKKRKIIKKTIIKQRHVLTKSCTASSIRKCSANITHERRLQINSQYRDLGTHEQKAFVLGCRDKLNKKRQTVLADSRRTFTYKYSLKTQ